MILKLEDEVYAFGAEYEYINSDTIDRIRLTRKRIYIWLVGKIFSIYVRRTKHNMKELQRLDTEIK